MVYKQDSFFTLVDAERVGLFGLSMVLALGIILMGWRMMRVRPVAVRLGIAIVLFTVFVWLSPQVYYTYYRLIFEGLPAQFVVGWPPFGGMLKIVSFTGPSNLSTHGQGTLFWVLVIMALAARGRRQ